VYFYANKYARIDHQQRWAKATKFVDPHGWPSDPLPSEFWIYALLVIIPIAYWSSLSFDVRRCRDAGWDPYWVWFRLLGPLYTLISPLFLGFAKSQSVEDAVRTRKLASESTIRTVSLSESVVREPTASPARRPSPRPRTVEEELAAREREDRKLLEAWRANRAKGEM
jgi:hypothetical protein